MAARRLIAVMLVLLFVSSIAAALAPVSEETGDETSTTTATETNTDTPGATAPPPPAAGDAGSQGDSQVGGALVSESVKLGGSPRTIRLDAGDQLQLRATSARVMTLELAPLGVTEDAGPDAPAYFDVLLTRAGSYELRELGGKRALARIEVRRSGI